MSKVDYDHVEAAIAEAESPEHGEYAYTLKLVFENGESVEAALCKHGPGWVILEQFYSEKEFEDCPPANPWRRFYSTRNVRYAEIIW